MDNSRPLKVKNLAPAGVRTCECCLLDASCRICSQLDRPESPLSSISTDTSLGKGPCKAHSSQEPLEICDLFVSPRLISCALL